MLIVRDGSTWTITSSRVERVGLGSGWTEVVCRTEWPAWVAEAVAQEAERDAVEFREQQERRARAEEEERLARERERAEAVEREVEAARQKAVLKAAREAARLAARAAAREQRAAERRGRARDAIADAETLRLVYASQRGPLAWAANKGGAAALAMWPGAATWMRAKFADPRLYGACEWCNGDAAEIQPGPHPALNRVPMADGTTAFLCDGCQTRATSGLRVVMED